MNILKQYPGIWRALMKYEVHIGAYVWACIYICIQVYIYIYVQVQCTPMSTCMSHVDCWPTWTADGVVNVNRACAMIPDYSWPCDLEVAILFTFSFPNLFTANIWHWLHAGPMLASIGLESSQCQMFARLEYELYKQGARFMATSAWITYCIVLN